MRKFLIVGFILSLIIFCIKVESIRASPDEIWVPHDYSTIQEAINAASTGDNIHVDGTYYEHIVVNKSVTLIGEGDAIIDGSGVGAIVTIAAHGVAVKNFTIQNSGSNAWDYGIGLIGPAWCRIENNCVRNHGNDGIYLAWASYNTVIHNRLTNSSQGIYLAYSSNRNTIKSNNITDTDYGILSETNQTLVNANMITEARIGAIVFHAGSTDNTIINNHISNNALGIWLTHGGNRIFHNNFINNTDQVMLSFPESNEWDGGWPSGGNFWIDHANVTEDLFSGEYQNQTGGDGICDAPKDFETANTDRYPLINSINVFEVLYGFDFEEISIVSNSTISAFQVNETGKTLRFNATGNVGFGFARIDTPSSIVSGLWQGNYSVLVNGEIVEFTNWTANSRVFIYFLYKHSENEIRIIPELPSIIILALFIVPSFFITLLCKRKKNTCAHASQTNMLLKQGHLDPGLLFSHDFEVEFFIHLDGFRQNDTCIRYRF
jgi:parallel beta-helix repeat protein